ncbi:MAG: hypothetical protein ACK56F_04630, partial [bacterium]
TSLLALRVVISRCPPAPILHLLIKGHICFIFNLKEVFYICCLHNRILSIIQGGSLGEFIVVV